MTTPRGGPPPGQPFGCRINKSRCTTHDLWEELGNQIYLYLSSVTVADVVNKQILGTSGVVHETKDSGGPAFAAQ